MGSPLDFLGGLQKGAEQLGSALGNFVSQAPSKPVPSPHAPLPQPQSSAVQPRPQAPAPGPSNPNLSSARYSYHGAVAPTPPSNWDMPLSQLSQNTGLTQLGENFTNTDKTNPDTFAGQVAKQEQDATSPLRQAREAWKKPAWEGGPDLIAPLEQANKWVNEHIAAPMQKTANPQFWFDDQMSAGYDSIGQSINTITQGVTGQAGHNYIRDAFAPAIKQITGEDVPRTPSSLEADSKALVEEDQRISDAEASLTPNSSPEDIAAVQAAREAFTVKAHAQMDAYDKSVDWWANSQVSKTLSVLGQLAIAPASFATSAVSFPLALLADPIGTGETTTDQVVMGINFAKTLLTDQARRDNMSSEELGANISNIVMLGGLMFGAKKAAGTTAKGLTSVTKSIMGTKPKQAIIDDIQTKLQESNPELHNPAQAPQVENPPVSLATHTPEQVAAHRTEIDGTLRGLQDTLQNETDVNKKAVLLKQINDLQDERKVMDNTPAPRPQPTLPTHGLWNRINELGKELGNPEAYKGMPAPEAIAQVLRESAQYHNDSPELYNPEKFLKDINAIDPYTQGDKVQGAVHKLNEMHEVLDAVSRPDELHGELPGSEKEMAANYLMLQVHIARERLLRPYGVGNLEAALLSGVRSRLYSPEQADDIARVTGSTRWKPLTGEGRRVAAQGTKNTDVAQDIGRERQGVGPEGSVARPKTTEPVYPTGSKDLQISALPKELLDFVNPEVQRAAAERNPQDYASPSSEVPAGPKKDLTPDEQMHMELFKKYQESGKHEQVRSSIERRTQERFAAERRRAFDEGQRSEDFPKEEFPASKVAEGPTTKFEELSPKTLEVMARDAGFKVVPLDKMSGNAWIMRNGKAINIGGKYDPQANHDMFIRAMKLPGDDRPVEANGEHNETKMDMMRSGMIRVSDFQNMFMNFGVDRFDHENLPMIEDAIRNDIVKKSVRFEPYIIDEWATGRHYTIDPQELAANNFDLGELISNIRTEERAKNGPMYGPASEVPKGSAPSIQQAAQAMGLKVIPSNKVEYGWLLPDRKGIDLGLPDDRGRASHGDLYTGFQKLLGNDNLGLTRYRQFTEDAVQLRRGYGKDINDHYFFANKWTPGNLKIVEDYLLSRSGSRPEEIMLESAEKGYVNSKFTFQDLKDNDFKLGNLLARRTIGPHAEVPAGPATEGPWLHDQYRHLRTAEGRVQMLEDRFNDYVARDVSPQVIRKVQNDLHATYEEVQKQLADLPQGELPTHLSEIRDRLQEKLNEKGYPAATTTGPESTTGEASQGLNKTPPGAEGTSLTSVVSGPEGKGEVAFWSPDAKSTRSVSPRERGRLSLAEQLGNEVQQMLDLKNEPEDIKALELNPANEARRIKEYTETIKANIDGLDPLGYVSPRNVIFDSNFPTEGFYEPTTGNIRINPTRSIPVEWLRGIAGKMQESILQLKGSVPEEGMIALHNWFEDFKRMTQAQLDWSVVAEEILHKHDVGRLPIKDYFEALNRLPAAWWDHARRSGIGDVFDEGITGRNVLRRGADFPIRDANGAPVRSWKTAFDLARLDGPHGGLDEPSFYATFHAFSEYRVTQLRNYHGVPGTKFTYRVPEVMTREIQNPDLIREGAQLAGDDFERYVQTETAYGLSQHKSYEEEAAANDASGNAEPTTGISSAPATGVPGRDTANQTHVSTEVPEGPKDWPQMGDILQIDTTVYPNKPEPWIDMSKFKPNWVNFWNKPLSNEESVRLAANIVARKGAGIIHDKAPGSQNYRIVKGHEGNVVTDEKGQPIVRKFQGEMAGPAAQEEAVPTGWGSTRENPESFHNIPIPNIEPVDLNARQSTEALRQQVAPNQVAQAGFSRKTLRLSQVDPVSVPVPHAIGEGYSEPARDAEGKPIAQSLKYKPLIALRDTGYPGTWIDFLKAMSAEPDSPGYMKARPYWDSLEPKYKRAWMETMQEPGVIKTIINAEVSPEAVTPEEMQSPTFLARQAKIQEYKTDVSNSGPMLDKLAKTVNTKEGLTKYAQAKGLMAMKAKYASLSQAIPELEAMQLAKAEYNRAMEEILNKPSNSANLKQQRSSQVESMSSPGAMLSKQLTPPMRANLEMLVTKKAAGTNKLAEGSYKSLAAFLDAYAIREPAAVKLYQKFPGMSKDAVKSLAEQYPQSFQLGPKNRLDQTSIPTSKQEAPDHINPVEPEQLRAVAQGAVRSIVRSGSTDYTEQGLEQGQANEKGLTSLGRLQARNLARAFRGQRKMKIVTSDIENNQETAGIIAKIGLGSKVAVDPNLRPWNIGQELTGISADNANPHLKDLMQKTPDLAPPGGESWNQFKARFLPAVKEHLGDKSVLVLSGREQRLAEAWIAKEMPDDLSIDEGIMLSPRGVGPGGIMALGNKPDGNYTVNQKVSQAASDAEAMAAPRIPASSVPLRPEQVSVNMGNRPAPVRPSEPVRPAPEGVSPRAVYTFKIGEQAETKVAKVKGEVTPAMPKDVMDRIDAIVADPSILPTNPLKLAALAAQRARKGVADARAMQVPGEVAAEQVRNLEVAVDRTSQLMAEKAQQDVKAAPLTAPQPKNKLIFDTSTIKAKDHQTRMVNGMDWAASTTRAAREILPTRSVNPLGEVVGMLKDGAAGLLPTDHMYHSLSPAFKDIFVDPKAVESVKQAKVEEAATQQGALPFDQIELAGVDVPVETLPYGVEQARKAATTRKTKPVTPQKSSVTPASADTMRAHNPSPDPPVEESIPDMQKRYRFELGKAQKMTTKELRTETDQIHEAINTEYPDLLSDTEEINFEDVPEDVHQAEDQIHETVANGSSGGGKGGGRDLPLEGWDDKRDMASSFGGDHELLSTYFDRVVKGLTKLVDASSQYGSIQRMSQAHVYAKLQHDNMLLQTKTLLDKMYPAKMNKDRTFANPDEQAKHEAMAKAIGGDEVERQKNLKALSPQDQAVAEMWNHYHKVLGRLGTRPETHLWDDAQEGYFRRQVLLDNDGNKPISGGKFNKKMSIAFERLKRDVLTVNENGKSVVRKENYYKDTQALEDAGFKVEKNIATLWANHYDQFANMSITHQFIKDMSTLESFAETSPKRGQTAWVGPLLVKRMSINPSTKQMEPALIGQDYWNQKQVRTVERGPFKSALRDYHVYYKLADVLERLASRNEDTGVADKAANFASYVNGIYKTGHFAYNPLHAFNLWSNIYAMGTHGLLDPATYFPALLQHRIFGSMHELMQEKGYWTDWDGSHINGSDFINRAIGWGAIPEPDITGGADLGGLNNSLSNYAPAFKQYHKAMWHDLAWTAHLGLIKHEMEVSQKAFIKSQGRPMNEAEFNNAGFIATRKAKEAMGFMDKMEQSHAWAVYARAFYLANSWSTVQLRLAFGAMPQVGPIKYMANIGGADRDTGIISSKMLSHGGMTQHSLDAINGRQGQMARKMMIGGTAKLLAMSTIASYIGSYLLTGNAQGPWNNAQRDLTHAFDIYGGVDANGKDVWQHNPAFGMQQEMLLYPLEGIKAMTQQGKNPWEAMQAMVGRYMGKEQPVLRTATDLAVGRNMNLWLKGWGENSAIDKDPQVIAIRRAIDATGYNFFPESLTNNIIYAVRSAFPFTPGFPDRLDTSNGTNPAETNATLGNTLNALGPGKLLGIGDFINAVQDVPGARDNLLSTNAQNALYFLAGSRESTSTTPEQAALNNQLGEASAARTTRDQALKDIAHAASTGDWKTVNEITQQLNLSTTQMTNAILHPISGGGQSVIYQGLPPRTNYTAPRQEALLGQELSTDDTAQLELVRNANIMATIDRVTKMASFQSENDTTRSADVTAYINLVTTMTNDQFAQSIGLLGGTPITDEDISGAVDTAIEFRSVASDALAQTELYQQADPIERQRMETHYGTFATTLARDAYVGSLKGVPLENIRDILSMTIDNTEAARSYVTNSMFYQLAQPYDQQRMLREYTTLAETMSKREALSQGQGSFDYHLTPEQIIPTMQFIINTEETGKAQLHITDFYNGADAPTQTKMDQKYETLARGLAFSNNDADPRQLIANSLNADQSYYDLQNQFGGGNYLKIMADELATVQRNIRTSSNYSPRQIAAIERNIRAQFLRANPAYGAWLRAKTNWAKYTRNGQVYAAVNSSEFSVADDMSTTGSNSAAALPYSSSPNMNPGSNLGLPRTTYDAYNAQNP